MKKQLITFETAKIAKQKSFKTNEQGYYVPMYNRDGDLIKEKLGYQNDWFILAPTQLQLEDWLLEKHSINIELMFDDMQWFVYVGEFTIPDFSPDITLAIECEGFEDAKNKKIKAREIALQEALKLIPKI